MQLCCVNDSFIASTMNKIIFLLIFIFNIPVVPSLPAHPIKLTSSMIKYDTKTKRISVECKVFIDDFAPAISKSLHTSIYQNNLTEDDLKKIENYFTTKYKITINGSLLLWSIESYDISLQENVLTLVFFNNNIKINKEDNLKIENELLFEAYGGIQSNWMTIRFPPYLQNYNFESKIGNSIYSHIF